jgi:hypothetical protein
MFVLALQRRRVQTVEPEDGDFLFRVWADWEFLIVALIRIRRSALVAAQVDQTNAKIMQAVARFDAALPDLRVMRNVAEHIDEYAVESERRHHRSIMRYGLEVGSWNDTEFTWQLDRPQVLNADHAMDAAGELLVAVRAARDTFKPTDHEANECGFPSVPKGP